VAATWPKDVIPVEIFSLIISYLSRSNVQNMRLVNKEFEEKVAHDLFQTVVVPFRPEIYGIAEEPTIGSRQPNNDERDVVQGNAAVMLQDRGMRVFQGFGRHIHRFGMSFEFDYQVLTKPPIKSDQEAITTFWGIYRWPFKKYNRYVQLEGLEETADETRTMAKALRFINNAKELALSIDGGLGWLAGPDVNAKAQALSEKAVVFGESRFRPEEKLPLGRPPHRSKGSYPLSSTMPSTAAAVAAASPEAIDDTTIPIFVRILREAGYEGVDLAQSVRTLMESEGVLQHSSCNNSSFSSSSGDLSETRAVPDIGSMDPYFRSIGYEGPRLERMTIALRQAIVDHGDSASSEATNSYPLKPNDLTNAQKEMLLETEWAQRAFMQSYAIAIIDNPATFGGIETLSISRLPSRHLAILRRGDFWASLSSLRKFSLAIIPDWRDIIKLPTSWVDDVRLQPSQAIWGVYQLLKDHIAPRESIKVLHFEWLCGGEEAAGLFARNQLILAAPFVPQAMDMVNGTSLTVPLLMLPYVEHLSLKNCWISPHILGRFVSNLKKQALKSLAFQSVSLSAPVPRNTQPGPVHMNHPQHHAMHHVNANFQAQALPIPNVAQPQANQAGGAHNLGAGFHVQQVFIQQQQLGALQHHGQPQGQPGGLIQVAPPAFTWLDPPRVGSWAYFIDQITPGETLASLRYARDLGPEPPASEPTNLKKIVFNSCGYIRLLLDFDQTMLDPPNPASAEIHAVAKRRNEIEQYMMKPQEHTLGVIINHINEDEVRTLETAWNLRMGWGKAGKTLAAQALTDGIRAAGQGRFRGKIESFASAPC
jgi:hypothetical protein